MDVLKQLEETTNRFKDAHHQAWHAREVLNDAERALAEAETRHTLAGLEGKNAETRKSELAALTESERAEVTAADKQHRHAQLVLTLAELDYRTARDLARLHPNYELA